MRTLFAVLVVALLAACGGGGSADLPAGQHDLGDHTSVAIHRVVDQVPGAEGLQPGSHVAAVDLEYFNNSDQAVDISITHRVDLIGSDNRQASAIALMDPARRPMGRLIPARGSLRGWFEFELLKGVQPVSLVLYGEPGDEPVTVTL